MEDDFITYDSSITHYITSDFITTEAVLDVSSINSKVRLCNWNHCAN